VLVVAGEVIGPEVAARVRSLTIRLVLLGSLMTAAVACGGRSTSRELSFSTADGGTRGRRPLRGAGGPDGVVLAHGAAFDKASWAPFATWLAGRGHQALAVDFRGYGRSTAGTDSRALFEDVLGAVRYLHNHGVTRVAVFGAAWEAAPSPKPPCEPLPVRSTV
jgi:hypothetical protein